MANDVTSNPKYKSEFEKDTELNSSLMKVRNNTELGEPHKRSVLGTGTQHREVILARELAKAQARKKRSYNRKNTGRSIGSNTTFKSNMKGGSNSSQVGRKITTFGSNLSVGGTSPREGKPDSARGEVAV